MPTTNDDASVWGVMLLQARAGVPVDVTPTAPVPSYYFDVKAQEVQLVSQCMATIPGNQARTNIGVGEQVNLYFNPALPTNALWSTTAGGLSLTSGVTNLFTAPDNATNVTITATIGNLPINLAYQVFAPTGYANAFIVSTNHFPPNVAQAQMLLIFYIGPTNVSFYRIQFEEVGTYGTVTRTTNDVITTQ